MPTVDDEEPRADRLGATPPLGTGGDALSGIEAAMLQFERSRWKYAGAKETRIREDFGMSAPATTRC